MRVLQTPFTADLRYWLELASHEDPHGNVEEPAVATPQTVACRLRANHLRPALLRQLAEVAQEPDIRADDEVLCDDEAGLQSDPVSERRRGVRLTAVDGLVGQLRDGDGAVDRNQRTDASPSLQLEPRDWHPLYACLGTDIVGLPIDERVEPVRGLIRSRVDGLLAEVHLESDAGQKPDIGVTSEQNVRVQTPALACVAIVAEAVQAEVIPRLESEDSILPAASARLRLGIGVIRLLLHGGDRRSDLRHGGGRRNRLYGHCQRIVAGETRPAELVGLRSRADADRPLAPFREGVAGSLVGGLVYTHAGSRATGTSVGALGADRSELPLVVVRLGALADQPQGDAGTDFPGDGDAARGGSGDRGVDHRTAGPEGRESAVTHAVRLFVAPTGRRGRRPRNADAHEGREGGEYADVLLHGDSSHAW